MKVFRDLINIEVSSTLNINQVIKIRYWVIIQPEISIVIGAFSNPDLIILAGFLLKFPEFLVRKFNNKVLNIHPALLPKYGGKGMYGMNVHKAVHENKEPKTGITIHYVNENYDEGAIIKQFECSLDNSDTPDSIAKKISKLEMENFPRVIEETLLK